MFQSPLNRVRAWVERTLAPLDDASGEAGGEAGGEARDIPLAPHPHRRELRWERDRRPGSVPPRPAHCISPVRPTGASRAPHGTAR